MLIEYWTGLHGVYLSGNPGTYLCLQGSSSSVRSDLDHTAPGRCSYSKMG